MGRAPRLLSPPARPQTFGGVLLGGSRRESSGRWPASLPPTPLSPARGSTFVFSASQGRLAACAAELLACPRPPGKRGENPTPPGPRLPSVGVKLEGLSLLPSAPPEKARTPPLLPPPRQTQSAHLPAASPRPGTSGNGSKDTFSAASCRSCSSGSRYTCSACCSARSS